MEGELGYINDAVNYTAGGVNYCEDNRCRTGYKGEDRLTAAPGPPCWGLGVRLTTPPRKKNMLPDLRDLPDRMKRLSEWMSE